jgi:L-alanine-DL-glutamate epimerase-like enolase superfamily enzyme
MVLVTAQAGTERGIGWTYGAAAARWVVADQLAPVVVGRSALDVAGAAEAMARAVRNIGRAGVAATAISAVDTALWGHEGAAAWLPAGGPAGPLA